MAVTIKWQNHIEAWKQSGLKQSEYCRQETPHYQPDKPYGILYKGLKARKNIRRFYGEIRSRKPMIDTDDSEKLYFVEFNKHNCQSPANTEPAFVI